MQAKDIMTTKVVTVAPDVDVAEVAKLLLERGVSAVPVIDRGGALLGIVSEGDLMRRPETETDRPRSWWLNLLAGPEDAARDYVKSHGRHAQDVMTGNVVTVEENTPAGEIAALLEHHRIKRVPVVRDGQVVGIVSRANLLQGLAAHKEKLPAGPSPDDRALRDQVLDLVAKESWVGHGSFNVIVNEGVVELWGLIDSDDQRKALKIAIEGLPGVTGVEDHLGQIAPYLRGT